MKRLLIILPLAVLLCGILTGWLGGSGMERHLEKQLGIDLPAGAAITYEDSHGGFHGDGVLTVVVECSDPDKAEGLIDDISQRWRESPIEPELWEQFRAAWRQNGEQIPLCRRSHGASGFTGTGFRSNMEKSVSLTRCCKTAPLL